MKFDHLAKKHGIEVKSAEIDPSELNFDFRSRWKCMFGCNSFGKKSCPPNVPDFDECVKFVKSYKKAILFRFRVSSEEERGKALQFMLDAERESLVNHSFAFAVFPGSCNLCDSQKCHENCHLARPSLSALCIDASKLSLGRGEMAGILLLD